MTANTLEYTAASIEARGHCAQHATPMQQTIKFFHALIVMNTARPQWILLIKADPGTYTTAPIVCLAIQKYSNQIQ